MRSFEEIPDIAERIKRSKMELQESGFYLAPEWDSQSCCDQDYVNNFKKGWESRQTEVDELTLQVAEMKSRLNDAYTDGQSAMYTARQSKVDELQKRVDAVTNVLKSIRKELECGHLTDDEAKTLASYADDLEQALKGEQP